MSIEIQFAGHSGMYVKFSEGLNVAIDPWIEGNPRCPASLRNPPKVDAIVLTHGHADHASSAVWLAKRDSAKVFATFELAALLQADGIPGAQLVYMNKGGTAHFADTISVSLTQAFHSSSYTTAAGRTEYAGEACGAVLQANHGRAVYHAGDTCLFSDMKLIGERYRPTVACLPIGDNFTMGPVDAASAVEYIKPQITIPIHFGTSPALTGTAEDFRECLIDRRLVTDLRVLEPGQCTRID